MLIVKRSNADIFFEGINQQDCENNMPDNSNEYLIISSERYDDYVESLVAQQELQDENPW